MTDPSRDDGAGRDGPLISVVTAALDALGPLRETVASVAAQDFAGREHIVVDGGSSDGTRAWLARQGPAVRWVSEPDDGIADALNKGVAMARGEYVLVLQAGDVLLGADRLRAAATRLARPDAPDVLVCDVLFGASGRTRRLSAGRPARRLLFKPVCHQGVFARRALFGRIGGFDPAYRISMDYEFLMRARRAGARVAAAPILLSRMPDDGISSRRDWPSLARRFAEERRIHLAHCPGPGMRLVYALYWPAYLGYRRLRAALAGG